MENSPITLTVLVRQKHSTKEISNIQTQYCAIRYMEELVTDDLCCLITCDAMPTNISQFLLSLQRMYMFPYLNISIRYPSSCEVVKSTGVHFKSQDVFYVTEVNKRENICKIRYVLNNI